MLLRRVISHAKNTSDTDIGDFAIIHQHQGLKMPPLEQNVNIYNNRSLSLVSSIVADRTSMSHPPHKRNGDEKLL